MPRRQNPVVESIHLMYGDTVAVHFMKELEKGEKITT